MENINLMANQEQIRIHKCRRVKGIDFSVAKISASGQCFRMTEQEDGWFQVIAENRRLLLKQEASGEVLMACSEQEFETIWKSYFDLDTDYRRFLEHIDPEDDYLQAAVAYGNGIRILRQDLWEMIISFIISQQNNIRRIRKCIETICAHYGTEQDGFFAFPTPDQLARATEDELRSLGLGYRSRYLVETAHMVADGRVSLDALRQMDYASARTELLKLCGVGAKVADCICLFGLHHLCAFPVDTHIRQVLASHYPDGFPAETYAGYEGVLQQYIFYYDLTAGD